MAGKYFLKREFKTSDDIQFEEFRSVFHNFEHLYTLYQTAVDVDIEEDFRIDKAIKHITTVEDFEKIVSLLNDKRMHIFSYHANDTVKVPKISAVIKILSKYSFKPVYKLESNSDSLNQFLKIKEPSADLIYEKYLNSKYIQIVELESEVNSLYNKNLV